MLIHYSVIDNSFDRLNFELLKIWKSNKYCENWKCRPDKQLHLTDLGLGSNRMGSSWKPGALTDSELEK